MPVAGERVPNALGTVRPKKAVHPEGCHVTSIHYLISKQLVAMVRVRDQIDLAVPRSDVFAYMDEPAHQAEITPSLVRSELIERLPNGGSRAAYTYSFLGVAFKGEVRATTYDPPNRIVFDMQGDLGGEIAWTFTALAKERSRLIYEAVYEVPIPVLQKAAEAVARRYNEREVRTLLANLKDRLETMPTA